MTVLAVPNWSFCDCELETDASSLISQRCTLHYCQGDVDHGRTVTAFSGDCEDVFATMDALCALLLPRIDLRVHNGVHPAKGALDVAPFVCLSGVETQLIERTRQWARSFSDRYDIPAYLYEKATFPGREHRLPVLRGQVASKLPGFDSGGVPSAQWGYSVVGVRDFLLAVNINFPAEQYEAVRRVAKAIRVARDGGNERFSGVRAIALSLKSVGLAQLSMNMTVPDRTSFDLIFEYASSQIGPAHSTELIGVIRRRDLPSSTMLQVDPRQIVD